MTINEINEKVADVLVKYPMGILKNTPKIRKSIIKDLSKETNIDWRDYTSAKIANAGFMFFIGMEPGSKYVKNLTIDITSVSSEKSKVI